MACRYLLQACGVIQSDSLFSEPREVDPSDTFPDEMPVTPKEEVNGTPVHRSGSFRNVVRLAMMIKSWVKHKKAQKAAKEGSVDYDNVRRVFEPPSQTEEAKVKEKWQRRILYWSVDDTSLTFYIWTAIVFIGCFYNLITIVAMVFEEVQRNFYDSWLMLNKVFDFIFLLDLFVLTRRG
ncbi:hypothetical protein COOONC_16771 [Cooperia oncophora]